MSELNDDIKKYLKGELSPAERHALEKKSLDDPFLADALEGGELINQKDFDKDVDQINKSILHRKWTFHLPLRIAAAILLLTTAGIVIYQFNEYQQPENLSLNSEESGESPLGDSTSGLMASDTADNKKLAEGDSGSKQKTEEVITKPLIAAAEQSSEKSNGGGVNTEMPASQPVEAEPKAARDEEMALLEDIAPIEIETKEPQKEKVGPTELSAKSRASGEAMKRSKSLAFTDDRTPNSKSIKGQVTSAEDSSPLPGVNVVVKGTTTGTITDASGSFQLDINEANPTLLFSYIGLESKELSVDKNQDKIDVELSLDVKQLSEVVVTGYGVSGKDDYVSPVIYPTLQIAQPEIGKESFQEYLKSKIVYPQEAIDHQTEGRVTIQFTVKTDGSLSDFNIIKGIGYGCEEELIRVIKVGPKWTPTSRNGTAMDEKVKVRFKFELPK